jgi:isochorismate synthase
MVEQQTTNPVLEKFTERVQEAMEKAAEINRPVLLSVSQEIDPIDPLRHFSGSMGHASERWYWEHPDSGLAISAAGVAMSSIFPAKNRFRDAKQAHQELADITLIDTADDTEHPGMRYFAGFSFDPERKPDRRIWKGFPAVYLCAPRVMLIRQGDRHSLVFTIQVSSRRDEEAILKSMQQLYDRTWRGLEKEPQNTRPRVDTSSTPEDEEIARIYKENVALASQQIRDGAYEKVVLARYRDISTRNYYDINRALDRLRTDYPGCYTFAIARQASIFLGASPEQLVQQDGKEVSAACLAGSIKRGETPEQDQQLANQLLSSAKDQHEHEVCARAIREALEPLCAEITMPEQPELLTFSNVHHLYTPVRGKLSNGSTLIDLVERLHPTPAVGGYPTRDAQAFIRENEGFDRGWYASPIGWLDAEGNGEFIVALRSAMISGQRARLFAGCGIVGESDPEQELAESDVKLRAMIAALESDAS